MVKKSKNLTNLKKITFFLNRKFLKEKKNSAKKKIPLCFSILGLCDLPKALQASPILRRKIPKNLKKSLFFQNISFFQKKLFKYFCCLKKCYPLSFTLLGGCDLTRALQSSPFRIQKGLP